MSSKSKRGACIISENNTNIYLHSWISWRGIQIYGLFPSNDIPLWRKTFKSAKQWVHKRLTFTAKLPLNGVCKKLYNFCNLSCFNLWNTLKSRVYHMLSRESFTNLGRAKLFSKFWKKSKKEYQIRSRLEIELCSITICSKPIKNCDSNLAYPL